MPIHELLHYFAMHLKIDILHNRLEIKYIILIVLTVMCHLKITPEINFI